jgi:hypothetical protein
LYIHMFIYMYISFCLLAASQPGLCWGIPTTGISFLRASLHLYIYMYVYTYLHMLTYIHICMHTYHLYIIFLFMNVCPIGSMAGVYPQQVYKYIFTYAYIYSYKYTSFTLHIFISICSIHTVLSTISNLIGGLTGKIMDSNSGTYCVHTSYSHYYPDTYWLTLILKEYPYFSIYVYSMNSLHLSFLIFN